MPQFNLVAFAGHSVRTAESTAAAGPIWPSPVILSVPGILLVMLIVAAGWGIYQRRRMPSNATPETTVSGRSL